MSPKASILGTNSSGVPHTENASSKSSSTKPIAPPKSPLPKHSPILALIPSGNPCLSITTGGAPAAINATTILAASFAFAESVPIDVDVYAVTSKSAMFLPALSTPFVINGTAASKSLGLDALIKQPSATSPEVSHIFGP